jgi:predicted transposase/invertase (TIGR01784 family)
MDIDSLEKGHDYTELPQSFIIFICTFDPYEMSRHLYTFENRCIQNEKLKLNDGTTKIFLNTKGTLDDIPKPLKMFLDYIDKGVVTDDYTKELEDAVVEIRADKRWRKRIMTLEQYAKEQAKEAAIDMKTRINKLNTYLIKAGRLEELEASFEDEDLQEKLLKEYNLID